MSALPSSAAKDNNGVNHHYISCASYGSSKPAKLTDGWSAQVVKKKDLYAGGEKVGTLKCKYNDELIGYNYSQSQVAGCFTGFYYDCSVTCYGGWADQTSTRRSAGTTTDWIYDDNSYTSWQGCVYWD